MSMPLSSRHVAVRGGAILLVALPVVALASRPATASETAPYGPSQVSETAPSGPSQAPTGAPDPEAAGELETRLREGLQSLVDGELDAALAAFEAAVELAPDDPRGHLHLGRSLLEAEQAAAAVERLERAAELGADADVVQFLLTRAWLSLDDVARADASLAAVEATAADHPLVSLHRGLVEYRRGHVGAALEHLDRAARAEPDWVEPRVEAARIALENGDPEAAADLLRDAVSRGPGIADLHALLGDALSAIDPDAATGSYRRAVELAPGRADLLFALARHLEEGERYAEARAVYSELLDLHPDLAQARFRRARILIRDGDRETALAEVERAFGDLMRAVQGLEPPPRNALSELVQMRYVRTQLLSDLGRDEEAVEEALQVVAVAETFPEGFYLLGTLLGRLGRPDEARPHLERFRMLSDAREQRQLGDHYLDVVGDPDRAAAAYRAALEAWPDDDEARLGLAAALRRSGDPEKALRHLRDVDPGSVGRLAWRRQRILALWQAGRRVDARLEWERAREAGLGPELGVEVWRIMRGVEEPS